MNKVPPPAEANENLLPDRVARAERMSLGGNGRLC